MEKTFLRLGYVGDIEGLFEYIASHINCWICMDTGEVTSGYGPDREDHLCQCQVDDDDDNGE